MKKKRATAFVPRMIVTGAVITVVPVCALEACSAGTSTNTPIVSGDDSGSAKDGKGGQDVIFIALAQQGFDSGQDTSDSGFIALAQQGFDSGADGADGS